MSLDMDYRESHLAPDKGLTYDASFDRQAYRKMVWNWERDILKAFAGELSTKKTGLRYLDFACGTGRILGELEPFMDESYGIDVSDAMLRVARGKTVRSKIICQDLTRKDIFPESYFDLITVFRFFLNAQQELREETLQALRKIIKNDGHLIFNIHMNTGCLLNHVIRSYRILKNIHTPDYFSMGIRETQLMVRKWGFEVIDMHHFGAIPVYSDDHQFLLNSINAIEMSCSHSQVFLPISRFIIYICRPITV